MGKLKPVDGTHMDGPASETDYQPVEDMVDTALLPGWSYTIGDAY